MPEPFFFELVSPERLIFSGEVISVQIPGAEGDFEVLAGHAPVLSGIRPGILNIKSEGDSERYFIDGGFADANPDGLTVLAPEIITAKEMTPERIKKGIEEAAALIESSTTTQARLGAQAKIDALKQLEA